VRGGDQRRMAMLWMAGDAENLRSRSESA
jgi:hypothetical protein